METVYVVQAYLTKGGKEERNRHVMYAGTNAKVAVEYLGWGVEAEVTIDLWVEGEVVHTLKQ